MQLNPKLENCIFYISRMYEFSHSQGQTRPSGAIGGTSLLPLIAAVMVQRRERQNGANRDRFSRSLDHLVGTGDERRRHAKPERLGGL
jgi:hypothetical protein